MTPRKISNSTTPISQAGFKLSCIVDKISENDALTALKECSEVKLETITKDKETLPLIFS